MERINKKTLFLLVILCTLMPILILVACNVNADPVDKPTDIPTEVPTDAPKATDTPAPTEVPSPTPHVYKKYFTMSFDDGITQDARIIEILKKYNMPCTFNINTGLCGANWTWVADAVNKPGLKHIRWTWAELESGIYNGYDVIVHTLNHPSLAGNYGSNLTKVTEEVGKDAENIKKLTGTLPIGMAYPGGTENDTSDAVIRTILDTTSVRFARIAVQNSKVKPSQFALPEYFMKWYPTCGVGDITSAKAYAKKFINAEATDRDLLFFLWGHGYELDLYNSWDKFEEIIKMISEADDIVCVTNTEFYNLFKDQIPSWKE